MSQLQLALPENKSLGEPSSSLNTFPASEVDIYDYHAFTDSLFWIIGVAVVVFGIIIFVREKYGEFIERDK